MVDQGLVWNRMRSLVRLLTKKKKYGEVVCGWTSSLETECVPRGHSPHGIHGREGVQSSGRQNHMPCGGHPTSCPLLQSLLKEQSGHGVTMWAHFTSKVDYLLLLLGTDQIPQHWSIPWAPYLASFSGGLDDYDCKGQEKEGFVLTQMAMNPRDRFFFLHLQHFQHCVHHQMLGGIF